MRPKMVDLLNQRKEALIPLQEEQKLVCKLHQEKPDIYFLAQAKITLSQTDESNYLDLKREIRKFQYSMQHKPNKNICQHSLQHSYEKQLYKQISAKLVPVLSPLPKFKNYAIQENFVPVTLLAEQKDISNLILQLNLFEFNSLMKLRKGQICVNDIKTDAERKPWRQNKYNQD